MRKFILRFSVFFILGYLLMTALDIAVCECEKRKSKGAVAAWTYLLDGSKIDADCLIMGNSRVLNHVVPAVLDTALNIDSYNIGLAGAHIDDMLARYRLYRENNLPPKSP